MVKFEVTYSGSGRKIKLADGVIYKIKDGDTLFVPAKDWYSTLSKSGNFVLAGKDKRIKKEIKKEEPKKSNRGRGKGGRKS